jgi:hypothetical protein
MVVEAMSLLAMRHVIRIEVGLKLGCPNSDAFFRIRTHGRCRRPISTASAEQLIKKRGLDPREPAVFP